MGKIWRKCRKGLISVVTVLFILQLLAFTYTVSFAYTAKAESAEHVLTYNNHQQLIWSNVLGIDENGVAELSLFHDAYQNTESQNGDKIIAPGTDFRKTVQLKNDAENEITYIAVLYKIKSSDLLPVTANLEAENAVNTDTFPLPPSVKKSDVVRAVKGGLAAGEQQDFDISWLWKYDVDSTQDMADTEFGRIAADSVPDDILIGLYIVVEEDTPTDPTDPDKPPVVPPTDPTDPDKPPVEPPTDPTDPDKPPVIPPTDPTDPNKPPVDQPGGTQHPNEQHPTYIKPQPPKTGDSTHIGMYATMLCVSGGMLLLLTIGRKQEND